MKFVPKMPMCQIHDVPCPDFREFKSPIECGRTAVHSVVDPCPVPGHGSHTIWLCKEHLDWVTRITEGNL